MLKPRLMAIDVGEKRIGIAISDPLGLTAQAHPHIENIGPVMQKIKDIIEEYQVEDVYVGLPVNRHGEDTKQTEKVRKFKESLEAILGREIKYVDERFSSKAAEKQLLEMDVSRKKRKQKIDSQAAAFMLEGILSRKDLN